MFPGDASNTCRTRRRQHPPPGLVPITRRYFLVSFFRIFHSPPALPFAVFLLSDTGFFFLFLIFFFPHVIFISSSDTRRVRGGTRHTRVTIICYSAPSSRRPDRLWRIPGTWASDRRGMDGGGGQGGETPENPQDKSVRSATYSSFGRGEDVRRGGEHKRHNTHLQYTTPCTYIIPTSTRSAVTFHKHQNIVRTHLHIILLLYYITGAAVAAALRIYCALLCTRFFFYNTYTKSSSTESRRIIGRANTEKNTWTRIGYYNVCVCVHVINTSVAPYRVSSRRDPTNIVSTRSLRR